MAYRRNIRRDFYRTTTTKLSAEVLVHQVYAENPSKVGLSRHVLDSALYYLHFTGSVRVCNSSRKWRKNWFLFDYYDCGQCFSPSHRGHTPREVRHVAYPRSLLYYYYAGDRRRTDGHNSCAQSLSCNKRATCLFKSIVHHVQDKEEEYAEYRWKQIQNEEASESKCHCQ